MKILKLATSALLLTSVGCRDEQKTDPIKCKSTTSSQQKLGIVGAEVPLSVDDIQSRATVGLRLQEHGYIMHCTGVVVGPQLVLTAAHCMDESPFHEVSFGANLPSATKIAVTSFMIHPMWDGHAGNNDVAWLKLKSPIPPEAAIAEVLRREDLALVAHATHVTLVGYGITSTQGLDPGVKRNTTTLVDRFVTFGFQDTIFIQNSFVLGPTIQKSACSGDSGGPAFVKLLNKIFLIGTTSGAPVIDPTTICERGIGIWTATHAYRDWIETTSQTKLGNPAENVSAPSLQPPPLPASPIAPQPTTPVQPQMPVQTDDTGQCAS